MRERERSILLAVCLAAGGAVYLVAFRTGALAPLGPLRNLAATLLACAPYAVAVWSAGEAVRPSRRELLLLAGGLVLLRSCLPLELLEGSDDAYRYLWDGLVQSHGLNPYAHPPQAGALAHLRDAAFYPAIYRPEMRTVYPPLAELWFWLAYRLSPSGFAGLKLILLLHDCASLALLVALLRRAGLPPARALVYAWSPLVLVQLFAGAHLDGLLVPWCLLSLYLAPRRPLLAGAALAAAAMVRPLMLLCLPALLTPRRLPDLKASALALLGFCAAAGLLLAPYASAGRLMVESLLVYARRWRFNGSLFKLAEHALGWHDGRPTVYVGIAVGSLASGLAPVERRTRYLLALGSYLALAPTVYPWYFVPVVALAALYRPGPLVVALSALIGISDLVFSHRLSTGLWEVPRTAWWLEYGMIYGLLALETLRYALRRRHAQHRQHGAK
jgi:hypothetical protein